MPKKYRNRTPILTPGQEPETLAQRVKAYADMLSRMSGIIRGAENGKSDVGEYHIKETLSGYLDPVVGQYTEIIQDVIIFIETLDAEGRGRAAYIRYRDDGKRSRRSTPTGKAGKKPGANTRVNATKRN